MAQPPAEAQPYALGQGLYLPQQALRIGGYTSIHYADLEGQPASLSIKDLSLFLTKKFGTRWLFFSELEIGDAITLTSDSINSRGADFDIERLYADYHARQRMTLRFGKFLTPVGQWSLNHADPLVWTVNRPLTTQSAFSRHATGAMVYGSVLACENDLDYWVFADNSERLDPAEDEEYAFSRDEASILLHNNFKSAAGARLLYHLLDDGLTLGVSYIDFELQDNQQRYLLGGVDFTWSSRYAELTAEAIFRKAEEATTSDEHGGYLQAVIPLPANLYLVGRHERYKTGILPYTTTISTVGFNYRPQPALAFKLEHRSGDNNDLVAPDGWLASFGVLF